MVLGLFTSRRREKLRNEAAPDVWVAILQRNFPLFNRMSAEDKRELLGHVSVFLDEKYFEGAGGLDMNDEIRVTIAAQACLLLMHRETDYYPNLTTVIVYPTGYTAQETRYLGAGLWEEGPEDRIGHTAHNLRALVIAWDAVLYGARDPADGHNVVFHEFAHQLDFENRSADGIPDLNTRADYHSWSTIMSQEFARLRESIPYQYDGLIDIYGAQNPTEFFAVATETFFERPRALKQKHPELYTVLSNFFRQEPVTYSAEVIE
ncbi:MAG TPA: M90 family metallopeptidase [Gemmatimonadaceae bacterium]